MSKREDPRPEIQTLSEDDLESVSGGDISTTAGSCETSQSTCTTSPTAQCHTSGGTCQEPGTK